MNLFKPPHWPLIIEPKTPRIFLAGSIEMGTCGDWQSEVTESFVGKDVAIYNPRRIDWDSSWEQSIHNKDFRNQVEWEMHHLYVATTIFMYFDPATKSPISLLELGLHATSGKLIVCCPDGFWRKGNVEVVCSHYGIPLYAGLDNAIKALHELALPNG